MASLGEYLREVREERNISLEEIASSTKIGLRHLEALENDRLDILPGGFFIKGIIRAYAKAIGLDPEEILGRYKDAGLLDDPGRKRERSQRAVSEAAPPLPPLPPSPPELESPPAPAPPSETTPGPETLPVSPDVPLAPVPAHELAIEEAPKARLSPAARKLIIGWVWRSAAVLLVVAALFVLWSSRRPRPPESRPTSIPETSVVAGGALPLAEPIARPEAPPAVQEVQQGVTIEITFRAETSIRVHADGVIKIDGLFPAGTTARAHAEKQLVISTGNAGGFTFLLNGEPAKPLGRSGQLLTDVEITPDNFKEFLEVRPPGPPAG